MSKNNAKLVELNSSVKEIEDISALTQQVLERDRNIVISHKMAIPTIAYEFLINAAKYLAEHKVADEGATTEINIMDVLSMGVSYRESDGENEGNFTPFAVPGPSFKKAIKDNEVTEED